MNKCCGDYSAALAKPRVMPVVDGLAWVKDSALAVIITGLEAEFAEHFCQGDRTKARVELLMKHERKTNWIDFEAGMRYGAVCCLIVWALWDCLVDSTLQDTSASHQLEAAVPVYRATGCLILLVWCWGLDVYVWTRARVNYLFIFDADHEKSMSYQEVGDAKPVRAHGVPLTYLQAPFRCGVKQAG